MQRLIPGAPDALKRYQDDPAFRHVTDLLTQIIGTNGLTSLDVRNAATLASLRWEERNMRPIFMIPRLGDGQEAAEGRN